MQRNIFCWRPALTTAANDGSWPHPGPGLTIESQRGTDLCTDVGVVKLADHVRAGRRGDIGISTERARCVVVALAACAAAGAVRRCADAATEYIRTREQFGRPVGAFQALQHKAATLLVNSELAASSAWDAVRAADESIEQHRLAAASAAVMAVAAAPDLVLDALLMFGAIGYTWEHDTHLYWRRATSLAASLGPMTRWTREVGELARTLQALHRNQPGRRRVRIPGQVAATLDEALSLSNDHHSGDVRTPGLAIGPQRDLLAQEGLVAPNLPAPWGVGASAVQQVIIAEEFGKRPELIRPSLGIAEWILPTILNSGSDLQRERFASPIAARRTAHGANCSANPAPARTWRRYPPGPPRSTGDGWSTGTRSGRRWRTGPSSEHCWPARIPTRRSTAASATSSST